MLRLGRTTQCACCCCAAKLSALWWYAVCKSADSTPATAATPSKRCLGARLSLGRVLACDVAALDETPTLTSLDTHAHNVTHTRSPRRPPAEPHPGALRAVRREAAAAGTSRIVRERCTALRCVALRCVCWPQATNLFGNSTNRPLHPSKDRCWHCHQPPAQYSNSRTPRAPPPSSPTWHSRRLWCASSACPSSSSPSRSPSPSAGSSPRRASRGRWVFGSMRCRRPVCR